MHCLVIGLVPEYALTRCIILIAVGSTARQGLHTYAKYIGLLHMLSRCSLECSLDLGLEQAHLQGICGACGLKIKGATPVEVRACAKY